MYSPLSSRDSTRVVFIRTRIGLGEAWFGWILHGGPSKYIHVISVGSWRTVSLLSLLYSRLPKNYPRVSKPRYTWTEIISLLENSMVGDLPMVSHVWPRHFEGNSCLFQVRRVQSCHVRWFSKDFDSFCGSTGFAYSVFIPWPRDFGRNWLSFDCIEIQCVSKFWWFWLLIWILCLNEFCLQCIYMDFERNKCLNIYLRFSRIFYLFVSILYYLWCYILLYFRCLGNFEKRQTCFKRSILWEFLLRNRYWIVINRIGGLRIGLVRI